MRLDSVCWAVRTYGVRTPDPEFLLRPVSLRHGVAWYVSTCRPSAERQRLFVVVLPRVANHGPFSVFVAVTPYHGYWICPLGITGITRRIPRSRRACGCTMSPPIEPCMSQGQETRRPHWRNRGQQSSGICSPSTTAFQARYSLHHSVLPARYGLGAEAASPQDMFVGLWAVGCGTMSSACSPAEILRNGSTVGAVGPSPVAGWVEQSRLENHQ